jgi:hypothetical protein
MFFLTSSPKRGGAARSRSFGSSSIRGSIVNKLCRASALLAGFAIFCSFAIVTGTEAAKTAITRTAADRCNSKLKNLENFAAHRKAGQKQETRFSEDEVNSYLALELKPKYHPCLKSLTLTFEEDRLQGIAAIDFDRLGSTSTRLLPKLLSFMLSGVHTMTLRGQLVSGQGKAWFRLEHARFDSSTLPRALVEEIISAVGRKQNPPFDPLQPSKLFDEIDRAEVHLGYILVYQ